MEKILDKYLFFGRILPSCISLLPTLGVLSIYFDLFSNFDPGRLSIIGFGFLISAYLVSMIGRTIAKIFEDFYFKNETNFPTTTLLFSENSEISENLRKIIIKNIKIYTGLPKAKNKNTALFKKELSEGLAIYRKQYSNNSVLLDLNIQYGFWRNLSACRIILIFFELPIFLLSDDKNIILILSTSLILSLIFYLFVINILKYVGKKYALYLLRLIAMKS
ncbi:hypothetical protein EHQ68_16665 [Leptospira congkakensis]|uniref:Uncharacterized protein n=1 Tax=Leptospira congkakensis TaxID=2484932 RepID=A0A8B5N140_9LEPT|nr:hypothetical protein [Leptospira congkakensis]TGL85791.1 hypothetical protein EHQ68_16665 [Leptospira congkakensis]TGL87014.1 hypothetical protein EHQ69_17835 [Leptospira congkakensis]